RRTGHVNATARGEQAGEVRLEARRRRGIGQHDHEVERPRDLPDEQRWIADHDVRTVAQTFRDERRRRARGPRPVAVDADQQTANRHRAGACDRLAGVGAADKQHTARNAGRWKHSHRDCKLCAEPMVDTRETAAAGVPPAARRMRQTRIVATLGPSTSTPEAIAALVARGADIFRLNFSHGTPESHAALVGIVRRVSREAGRFVSILQDLPGPKIRVGPMADPVRLSPGDALRLEYGTFQGTGSRVSVSFAGLFAAARAGHRLLLDDGRIEVEVQGVSDGAIDTRVVTAGTLSGG